MQHKPDWDNQFFETIEEKRERWAAERIRRRINGQCWQCAKKIRDCNCPNVNHMKKD